MIEKTIFIADDGTHFEDEDDCLAYELMAKFQNIENEIDLYDENMEPLSLDNDNYLVTYDEINYFYCKTNRAAEFLTEFADIRGYTSPFDSRLRWEENNVIGLWYFDIDTGRWANINDEIRRLEKIKKAMLKDYQMS
jgi:hypothetical protein